MTIETTFQHGWPEVPLGQFLSAIEAGKNLRCEERPPEPHEKGVVKVSSVTWGIFDKTQSKTLPSGYEPNSRSLIRNGDFLISRANTLELVGACVVVEDAPGNLYLSDKVLRLVLPDDIKPWLLNFLRSPIGRARIEAASTGNQLSMRNISQETIRSLMVPLPDRRDRQRTMAKIESVSANSRRARDHLDHTPRLVEKYKQAILAAAFRGDLTREWRAAIGRQTVSRTRSASASPSRRLRRSIPEIASPLDFVSLWPSPATWKLAHLGRYILNHQIVDVKDGNHGANHPRREDFASEGVPFITAAQLAGDVVDFDTAPRLSGEPLKRLKVGFAEPGDVILSHKGTVGRVAICDAACVLSPQTTYYRPAPCAFTPEFLRFQLLSPFFQRQLDEVKSQTTRDFVPISEQYKLFLFQPPLDEQQQLAARLHTMFAWINRLAAEATSARKLIDHLDQAVLAKAFRGELVPQDPNDEPASALLERIRATRQFASTRTSNAQTPSAR